MRLRKCGLGAAVAVVIVLLPGLELDAQKPGGATAAPPRFQVDPGWPKALPNNWILGAVTGFCADAKHHFWFTNLP